MKDASPTYKNQWYFYTQKANDPNLKLRKQCIKIVLKNKLLRISLTKEVQDTYMGNYNLSLKTIMKI